ncbi:MAG: transglutaminase domain-containing protein [Gordonibacter sp.]
MKRLGAHKSCPEAALRRAASGVLGLVFVLFLGGLVSCGNSSSSNPEVSREDSTSGPSYEPKPLATAAFNPEGAVSDHDSMIDVSALAQGYVAASANNESRLKFQVAQGETEYNYDLPGDGTPIVCPLNMGSGTYVFSILQNTSGERYVPINTTQADAAIASEFEPFIRPNLYCSYDANSASVIKASELAAGAQNEGDVLREVYTWIVENITYDTAKAEQLTATSGYIPNPDATLAEKKGICFDYVSLGAAMLRSQGIPCKIVTGYVSPDSIYHAWNLVYLDGRWTSVRISVEANTWTRIDLTFASAGSEKYTGNAKEYTDRYTY